MRKRLYCSLSISQIVGTMSWTSRLDKDGDSDISVSDILRASDSMDQKMGILLEAYQLYASDHLNALEIATPRTHRTCATTIHAHSPEYSLI